MAARRHPFLSRTGSLLAALLLTACAGPEPVQRPEIRLNAAWSGVAAAGATVDATQIAWPSYFTDPRLQALITRALANNRDLRIAAARVQQGRADYKSVSADRLPSLTGQVVQSRTYTPQAFDTGASTQRIDTQALLSYEFDFWGRVASMSDSARASFLASEEARRQVQLSLIADVANAYFALLEREEGLVLARAMLGLRIESLAIASNALTGGGADEDERQQAETGVEHGKSVVAQYEHARNTASNLLDYLVGGAAGDLPHGWPLAEQRPGAALAPGVPSEVLLRRPDVRAAEQRLAAASADIAAARAAFLPKVMLTAALGMASPALATLFSGGAWSYQPLASIPIFDNGRTAANLDSARARRNSLLAEYEKAVQQAFREVSDQLSARQSLRLQIDAGVAMQTSQARRLAMVRGRHQAGAASYREVVEAQRALLDIRQSMLGLRRAEQETATGLYKALGGGTDDSAAPVAVAAEPTAPVASAAEPSAPVRAAATGTAPLVVAGGSGLRSSQP